jgi:hypothetical protein
MSKHHHESHTFAAQAIEGQVASSCEGSGYELANRVLSETQYASPGKWSQNNLNYPSSLECTNCYAEAIPACSGGFTKAELAGFPPANPIALRAAEAYPGGQGTLEKMGGALRSVGRFLGIKPSESDRIGTQNFKATWDEF